MLYRCRRKRPLNQPPPVVFTPAQATLPLHPLRVEALPPPLSSGCSPHLPHRYSAIGTFPAGAPPPIVAAPISLPPPAGIVPTGPPPVGSGLTSAHPLPVETVSAGQTLRIQALPPSPLALFPNTPAPPMLLLPAASVSLATRPPQTPPVSLT